MGSRAAALRGFTIAEMLAVVAIIGVLTVMASPTFIRQVRDRRVNAAAMKVIDYLRTARMRAIGRGLPILVRWNSAGVLTNSNPGSTGLLQMVEPIVVPGTPVRTCAQTDFTNIQPPGTVGGGVQILDAFDLKASDRYSYSQVVFQDDQTPSNTQAIAELCFSPTGRTYVRYLGSASAALTTPLVSLSGVASFVVTNVGTGQARTIFVPPNGMARMAL